MRIAIPVAGETVASPLGDAEGFRFYEDDHGRIVRQFLVPMEERSTKAAIDLLGATASTRCSAARSTKMSASPLARRV